MGATTDAFVTLNKVMFETKNEILALSEAFAEQRRQAREAAGAQDPTGMGRSSSGTGGGASRTGASSGSFPGRGGTSSGGGGRTRGGSSSGGFGGNQANPYSGFTAGTPYNNQNPYGGGSARGSSTSLPVITQDDATASEVRGLRNDLKKNNGSLL